MPNDINNDIREQFPVRKENAGKFKAGEQRTKDAGRKGGQSKGKNKEIA